MTINKALILLFTHGLPILFFMYIATDIFLRNKKKTEHILVSLIALCYLLLFVEEYIRNQVSIEYSARLSTTWFSSFGIIITCIGFHFLMKFTQLARYLPKYMYPYTFYLPVIFVVYSLVTGANLTSAQQFEQIGMWIYPIYNANYYLTMAVAISINILYLIPLFIAKSRSLIKEQRSIYNFLIIGFTISVIWNVIFGYIHFGDALPPYPYIYSGIIWCFFLRLTMKKHDFLNLYDKRYEKLFEMSPNAILLINKRGEIKNSNPSAVKFFDSVELNFEQFYDLLNSDIKESIKNNCNINHYETVLEHNNKRTVLLIYTNYVLLENEMHVFFIIQDITAQKNQQEEIYFLAYHDSLTRLPNRRFFYKILDEELEAAKQNNHIIALYLIDLDKFKLLNDTRGHLVGDEVLQIVAQSLLEVTANFGVAARLGGDEFIMFINHSLSNQNTEQVLQQIQQQFSKLVTKYVNPPISLSIGVSYFPQDSNDKQALINIADTKMYSMKRGHVESTQLYI
ncbi:sensor domain-containing diguanylate cyclase [Solibacillus sp. CAU 1738]|uniref:sensor domain-containing diguanylate cyclase n=1 Tax=Solibacillus sp. CAU 1738 TaxID=3140363 RepID=UPI0032610E63